MANSSRARKAHAAISLLVEKFSAAFIRVGDRKPLKVGIRDDLLARGIDPKIVVTGLGSYCHSVGYLRALKAGAPRIDLDGNAAGAVTASDAAEAAQRLAAAVEKQQQTAARKAAEEQAKAAAKRAKAQPKAPVQKVQPKAKAPAQVRVELTRPARREPGPVVVERRSGRKVTTYDLTSRPPILPRPRS